MNSFLRQRLSLWRMISQSSTTLGHNRKEDLLPVGNDRTCKGYELFQSLVIQGWRSRRAEIQVAQQSWNSVLPK